jgi:hypothetical protein
MCWRSFSFSPIPGIYYRPQDDCRIEEVMMVSVIHQTGKSSLDNDRGWTPFLLQWLSKAVWALAIPRL